MIIKDLLDVGELSIYKRKRKETTVFLSTRECIEQDDHKSIKKKYGKNFLQRVESHCCRMASSHIEYVKYS